MAYSSNRHYRVAKRDKDLELETEKISKDTFMQLTLMGIMVYFVSIVLSLTLGYFIGKEK